ncbi:LruC domain-containing protein [Coprobacter tertius]|uniref:LruC domain-containing protein n=1 Tax=Coprobacter tertius TaxID=2944915 RepID=A0ABT1MJN9_9BACT|nr:LruC domain-containing protein [Coprobacter tertius]MCP9611451.1 LruC domain-containing protein [Coprobacter tertius]
MNDVVVEYEISKYFGKNNKTEKLHCEFTPVYDGGTKRSGFGFVIDNASITARVIDASEYPLDNVKDIVLFDNNAMVVGRTFNVDLDIEPTDKDELIVPFNPFIFVDGDRSKEVHLTKMKPTAKANQKGYSEFAKKYVTGGNFPFAMNIPIVNFKVSEEMKRIDSEYPLFIKWVEGDKSIEWYKK